MEPDEFNRRDAGGNACDIERRLRGGRRDVDVDAHGARGAEVGLVDLQIGEAAELGAGVGQEVERTVQQTTALEGRGLGDPVQRLKRRVNLKLVSVDLLLRQGARVG